GSVAEIELGRYRDRARIRGHPDDSALTHLHPKRPHDSSHQFVVLQLLSHLVILVVGDLLMRNQAWRNEVQRGTKSRIVPRGLFSSGRAVYAAGNVGEQVVHTSSWAGQGVS